MHEEIYAPMQFVSDTTGTRARHLTYKIIYSKLF